MDLKEKLRLKTANPASAAPVKLAFLGDSVTHGCFEIIEKAAGCFDCVYDQDAVYHNRLRRQLAAVFPNCPATMINAGISGGSAQQGAERVLPGRYRGRPRLGRGLFRAQRRAPARWPGGIPAGLVLHFPSAEGGRDTDAVHDAKHDVHRRQPTDPRGLAAGDGRGLRRRSVRRHDGSVYGRGPGALRREKCPCATATRTGRGWRRWGRISPACCPTISTTPPGRCTRCSRPGCSKPSYCKEACYAADTPAAPGSRCAGGGSRRRVTNNPTPCFSWAAAADGKERRQAACRVTVSSGASPLWDSGWIEQEAQELRYAGRPFPRNGGSLSPLKSGTPAGNRVRPPPPGSTFPRCRASRQTGSPRRRMCRAARCISAAAFPLRPGLESAAAVHLRPWGTTRPRWTAST